MQELEENPNAQELEIVDERPKRLELGAQLPLSQRHITGILQRNVGILIELRKRRMQELEIRNSGRKSPSAWNSRS